MSDIDTMPGHLIRRAQQSSTAIVTDECGASDLIMQAKTPAQWYDELAWLYGGDQQAASASRTAT